MSIASKYEPAAAEAKWYAYWMEHKLFSSQIDHSKEPYTIVIPPPNVTGVLHMGHMLNNTIQDVLIRRARMQGKNACWVPGTDHASIATETKVVQLLKERGIDKKDISREEFLTHAWEWKEKYGGIILEQLKKLGASCDWDRTAFTMDPGLSDAVISVFVDLYKKGKIYRGIRMVNWDPKGQTALSDDEVIMKEVPSKLYYIKYKIEGSEDQFLTIATTRPETIMADVAICINPNDPRFTRLKGKKAIIPLINRAIPIIEDEYVDMEFGTGCLKVTPAHDINDYELGIKHKLEVIDILNDNGTLNEKAQILVGEDRFIARKKIGKLLDEAGQLEKIEDYKSNVGHSERTDAVIKKMSDIALNHPGVAHSIAFPGLSINGFTNSPNSGVVFVALDDFELRKRPELSANAIAGQLNQQFAGIQDAFIAIFPPPPVQGLGTIGGFRLQIQDRANLGYEALYQVTQQVMYKAWADPQLAGIFSSYQVNVPQLELDIDRTKAKQQAVSLDQIFQTLQTYMGSTYVNDFNRFGRTYQVNMQADEAFRQSPQQISQLKVPNVNGDMIPLGSFINVSQSAGPDRVMHYNGFTTAEINGGPAPGVSSGQAQAAIEKILAETLPIGMTYEWTELTYQQILAGNTGLLVFPLVILLVFMVLAAQYESLSLPLAIILIIPMTLLSALSGVLIYGGDNNIFTQIGLIVLVGLATKNAILIVEFAKEKQDHGMEVMKAILEAARLRLRPILMTSIAFIMGVVPMVFSTGAGAEMRQAMGVAVFAGMIGVTLFGLILTPLFYYALAKRARHSTASEV